MAAFSRFPHCGILLLLCEMTIRWRPQPRQAPAQRRDASHHGGVPRARARCTFLQGPRSVPDRARRRRAALRAVRRAELGLRLLHAARGAHDRPIGRARHHRPARAGQLPERRRARPHRSGLAAQLRRTARRSWPRWPTAARPRSWPERRCSARFPTTWSTPAAAIRSRWSRCPTEVAFADVTEYVAAAGAADTGARLSASLVRQRQLLSAIAVRPQPRRAGRPDLHRDRARLPGDHRRPGGTSYRVLSRWTTRRSTRSPAAS